MAQYWVSPTGNDSNLGTQLSPFLTIQRGVNVAVPNDTINVENGIYEAAPGDVNTVAISTSQQAGQVGQPITLKSVNQYGAQIIVPGISGGGNNGVLINRSNWILDGFDISGGGPGAGTGTAYHAVNIQGSANSNIVVKRCRIHDIARTVCSSSVNGFDGIAVTNCNDTTIEDNIIYAIGRLQGNLGESGCSLTPGGGGLSQNDHGIYLITPNGVTIRRNIFYDCWRGYCIHVFKQGGGTHQNIFIYNNVFSDKTNTTWPPAHILLANTCTNIQIKNNISYDPLVAMVNYSSVATFTNVAIDFNLCTKTINYVAPPSGVTTGPSNKTNTDPVFVSPSTRDYHLMPTSPAINTGTNVGLPFNGTAPDMGVFETAGNIYYVATNGNDSSGTGTEGNPWQTPSRGISALLAGDILYFRGGTYLARLDFVTPNKSGTASARIIVSSYPGETATFAPSNAGVPLLSSNTNYITFQNMVWDGVNFPPNPTTQNISTVDVNGNRVQNSVGITLINVEIKRWRFHGLYVEANDITLRSCNIHDQASVSCIPNTRWYGVYFHNGTGLIELCTMQNNPGGGIQVFPGSLAFPINGLRIRRNKIFGNNSCDTSDVGGIIVHASDVVGAVDNVEIYNNLIYDNKPPVSINPNGIRASNQARGTKIWNNTIYGHPNYGIVIQNTTNTDCRNNIVYGNTTGQINQSGNTGLTSSSNVTTNPLFANEATRDFHLLLGSPAIGTGVVIAQVSVDYDGVPRGNPPDVGAYEFTGSAPDTTPPAVPTGLMVV